MITRYQHQSVTWIDLENPKQDEVRELMEEFRLPPSVAEDLMMPTLKPRVEFHDNNLIYLILHFPAFRHTHGISENQEVDFVIGKNFLITTRYDMVDPLHKFSKVFEVNSLLSNERMGEHAGMVFVQMVRKLYRSLEHELEYIADSLRETEQHIFQGRERAMVIELSRISRELINFRQAVSLHKEVLKSFEVAAHRFFGDDFTYHVRTIMGEYYRIENGVLLNIDTLGELRDTNNSLLSTKQNETMKILTIMTFITAPLALFANLFSMNTLMTPLIGHPFDFWIIVGIMAVAVLAFCAYFLYKKWI